MDKEKINIFISHCGDDEKHIEPFKQLIGSRYSIRDSSIVETEPNRAHNEQYIKSEILAPQIRWAGKVIVLIGPQAHDSDYVNWEIKYAINQGKRLIGVYLPGAENSRVPEWLEKYGDALVPWNAGKIAAAIGGEPRWERGGMSGGASAPMKRESC